MPKRRQGKGRAPDRPSDMEVHPSFCFSCNTVKNYTLADACKKDHTIAKVLLKKFQQWETVTKGTILQAPRTGLGTETIAKKSFKAPMPKNLPDDVTLLAIRLSDKARLVGFWEKQ